MVKSKSIEIYSKKIYANKERFKIQGAGVMALTAICAAGATNSIYRRAKSDIWLAIPPALCACGMEINMDNKKNESMEERAKKEELVVMLHSIRKVAEAHNESHTISHIDRLLSEMNDR